MEKVSSAASPPIRLAVVSCGLGHVHRGFEVAAMRWAEALKTMGHNNSPAEIDVRLFCGGAYPGGVGVWNLPRDGKISAGLRRIKVINDGCRLEQASFGVGFIGHILQWKPDVIWTQEATFAHTVQEFTKFLPHKYSPRIIFCNGAPNGPEYYSSFDFVQHLHPNSLEDALSYGIAATKMAVLPHCTPTSVVLSSVEKESIRCDFSVSEKDWMVVCVAAWNKHHKRIDYLIKEVAALKNPHLKLILCGQPEAETQILKSLGKELLGDQVQWHTLSAQRVLDVMSASDVFVLPSLTEGLGAVLIEAAMSGVPIVCHPHAGGKFIVGNDWPLIDMSKEGALTFRLLELYQHPPEAERMQRLRERAIRQFSSESLAPKFAELVKRVAVKQRQNGANNGE